MTTPTLLLIVAVALAVGLAADFVLRRASWNRTRERARARARSIVEEAEREAQTIHKEVEIALREREAALETEAATREASFTATRDAEEAQLQERRAALEREEEALRAARAELDARHAQLTRDGEELASRTAALQGREAEVAVRLEALAGLTREQARERLMAEMTAEAREHARDEINRVVESTKSEIDDRIRELVLRSLQRVRKGGVVESTVSVVRLPSDDMKGRIIGREGRNIRSLEMTTGIDLIVDDTPATILISCFDPLRREIARIAIERLVEDGRIHPARIEELVEKTRADMERIIEETGEAAAFEMGIQDLHSRLIRLLGRLKYHTAQGQNLLQHCRETADLAGALALELGGSPEVARRAGLLHEVAQAAQERPTAPSILASGEMSLRHGESRAVQQAIAAAHPDVTPRNLDGALVRLACRLSRTRVGARKHNLEVFISRLRRLETLAASYPGVKAAHVFRAGKELRVLVESGKLSDAEAVTLSRELVTRLRREVDLPGEVKVSVLRETRAVDYAL